MSVAGSCLRARRQGQAGDRKLARGASAGTDLTDYLGDPTELTFRHEAGVDDVSNDQGGKLEVDGNTTDPANDTVYIRVSEKSDSTDLGGKTWFAGEVTDEDTFTVTDDTIEGSESAATTFKDDIYIHIYDGDPESGGTVVQTIKFHAKADKPIYLNDQYASLQLTDYVGDGSGTAYADFQGINTRGLHNHEVYDVYCDLFEAKALALATGDVSDKLEVEVMSLALSMYVTDQDLVEIDFNTGLVDDDLDGNLSPDLVDEVESYGFLVTAVGVAEQTWNVQGYEEAFQEAIDANGSSTELTILQIMTHLDTNTSLVSGLIYDGYYGNEDGDIDEFELLLRQLANSVVTAINLSGSTGG